jgi:putative transposase
MCRKAKVPDSGFPLLTTLNSRGVQDILIAAADGLTGLSEAINSIFPETEVQLCIIRQVRNSMKYVASKNQKAFWPF